MKPSAPFLRPAFPFTFIHLAEEFIHTDAQVKENLIVGGGDVRGEAIEGSYPCSKAPQWFTGSRGFIYFKAPFKKKKFF